MTWGELRQAVLEKLDSPDRAQAGAYLPAMVQGANEGLMLLAAGGSCVEKRLTTQGEQVLDLAELAPDFCQIHSLCRKEGGRWVPTLNFRQLGRRIWLPDAGEYLLEYGAYEGGIGPDTPEEYRFTTKPEALALLPLYIASQIYKHDNAQLAVIWRNEFEIGLEALQRQNHRQPGGWVEFTGREWR